MAIATLTARRYFAPILEPSESQRAVSKEYNVTKKKSRNMFLIDMRNVEVELLFIEKGKRIYL